MSTSIERVLITGGSGFIGTNLVQECLNRGYEVLNLSEKSPGEASQHSLWREVNILDGEQLKQHFQEFKPTLVFHLAARTDLHGKTLEDYAANMTGVSHMLDAIEATPSVRRSLFASTRLVFRIDAKPKHAFDYSATTLYGESKIEGERLVKERDGGGKPWVIFRPTSIWGPWFHIPYRNFFDSVRRGIYIHPKGRRIRKSFGFVGNIVYEMLSLALAPAEQVNRRAFFLADYEPLEVLEWGRVIQRQMRAPRIKQVSMPVLKTVALVGDAIKKTGWDDVPITSFRLQNLLTDMVYDMTELEAVVGPLPFSQREGVAHTVKWLRQHS